MKKLKLLPSILMLVLCVGVLAVGVFAITPTENQITGSITINASNEPVTITIYKDSTDTTPIKTVTVRAGATIPIGSAEFALGTANEVSDVLPIKYILVFSTTSTENLIIDTETIEQYNAVAYADNTRVVAENAVAVTKYHEYLETDTSTGLACFTSGKDYTITCTFKLGTFVEEKSQVNFNMSFDIYKANEYTGKGINGVDYLYFGEYPQSEAKEGVTFTRDPNGAVFKAYEVQSSEENATGNAIYNGSDGNRYVEIHSDNTSKYYLIEPLKWRILDHEQDENGKYSNTLLMCDAVVEQVQFRKNYYDAGDEFYAVDSEGNIIKDENEKLIFQNNYVYSDLRKYLKETFYNNAFNSLQKQLVKIMDIDNSVSTTSITQENSIYVCDNILAENGEGDPVFALSYADATNTKYGFNVDDYNVAEENNLSIARLVCASDYAQATGVSNTTTMQELLDKAEVYGFTVLEYLMDDTSRGMGFNETFAKAMIEYLETNENAADWFLRSPNNDSYDISYARSYDGAISSTMTIFDSDAGHGTVPALRIGLK